MIIKPPLDFRNIFRPQTRVFLAGSIEMGKAEDWQTMVGNALDSHEVCIYNPRRDEWDASWNQSTENPLFVEQVEWELNAMQEANIVLFNFEGNTLSPISLMELGLVAKANFILEKKVIVCCPQPYWRKGNVDVVCDMYDIERADNLEKLIEKGKQYL